ncbi:MAG: response regulator [Bacteroidota bacterium]
MDKPFHEIHIIDDNEVDTYISEHLIEELGLSEKISSSSNGQDALDYLNGLGVHQPDIVFLDVRMPVMGGFEFLEKYSEFLHDKPKKPKIFMLTSSSDPFDVEKAGVNPLVKKYFSKPLSPEILQKIKEGKYN